MSGYNELIDNYEIMRESVRQYFAFGVQSRSEYAEKSGLKKAQDLIVQRLNSFPDRSHPRGCSRRLQRTLPIDRRSDRSV